MRSIRYILPLALALLILSAPGPALTGEGDGEGEDPGPISTYEVRQEEGWFDADYVYGITKTLTSSSLSTGAQVPLLPFTLILDTALLPFELIAACIA